MHSAPDLKHHFRLEENVTQVALVTGATGAIGQAIVRQLAARDGFEVVLAARNEAQAQQAVAEIQRTTGNPRVRYELVDVSRRASIEALVARWRGPLHVLINNAGGSIPGKQARFTADGFEMTFGTNHLGHFLFTNLLLDSLTRSAPARVITVSSQLHIPGYAGGKPPDFDYDNLKGEKYYDANVFYRNSKLANMWFTYELQRRLTGTGVTSNAVCPGFVPAAIAERRTSPVERFLYKQILARMPFARSLEQASTSYMVAATDPGLEGVGGKFIVDGKERCSSEESYDEQRARRLWDASWAWCGLGVIAP